MENFWDLLKDEANWKCAILKQDYSLIKLRPRFNGTTFSLAPEMGFGWDEPSACLIEEVGLYSLLVDGTEWRCPFDPMPRNEILFHPQIIERTIGRSTSVPWIKVKYRAYVGNGDSFVIIYTIKNLSDRQLKAEAKFFIRSESSYPRESVDRNGHLIHIKFNKPAKGWFPIQKDYYVSIATPGVMRNLVCDQGPIFMTTVSLDLEIPAKGETDLTCQVAVSRESFGGADQVIRENIEKDISHTVDEIRNKWNKWCGEIPRLGTEDPEVLRAYYKSWSILRMCEAKWDETHWTISGLEKFTGLWLWDISPFINEAYISYDVGYARKLVLEQLKGLREDGFLPYTPTLSLTDPNKIMTQPPMIAYTVERIHRADPDRGFLEEVFPKLIKYYDWLNATKDIDGFGLWLVTDQRSPFLCGPESGMDDSPIYDAGEAYGVVQSASKYGFEVAMAEMSKVMGMDANVWFKRAERTKGIIRSKMWSGDENYYFPLDREGNQIRIKTSDGFFALFFGVASSEEARLMGEVIEAEFLCGYGVRSVSRKEKTYSSDCYWRGPVWPAMNYVVSKGLRRYGLIDLAAKVEKGTMRLPNTYPGIWECYVPESGIPARTKEGPMVSSFISFSAAGIYNAIRNLFGET